MIWVFLCWVVAVMAIGFGFYTTKEVHRNRKVTDSIVLPSILNISSDTFIGWIFGAVISVISSIW